MVRHVPRRSHRRGRTAALAAGVVVLLGGCANGERARLATELSTIGNDAADALLDRFALLPEAVYTANYDVVVAYTGDEPEVTTTQAAADQRSLTIGAVRYLVKDGVMTTCQLDTGRCEGGHDAALVSDVQMTNDFFGTSMVARFRRDVAAAIGPIESSDEQIAGQEAACVTIPLSPSSAEPDIVPQSVYCVLANGVLARLGAADISAELADYSTEADDEQFTTSRASGQPG